jgi:cytochrome c-type biogenesis protein CcmH
MMATYALLLVLLAAFTALLWRWLRQTGLDKRQSAALCLLVALLGAGSYALVGNHGVMQMEDAQKAQAGRERGLIAAIEADQGNIPALLELAALYQELGHHGRATPLFRQAVLISKGNPEVLAMYGESLVLEAGGKVTEDAKKAFDMALLQAPEQPQSRFFTALYSLQQGDAPAAMATFKQLRKDLPNGHPMREWLDGMAGSVGK